jgi:hypothetical protein
MRIPYLGALLAIPAAIESSSQLDDFHNRPFTIESELKAGPKNKSSDLRLRIYTVNSQQITDPEVYSEWFGKVNDALNPKNQITDTKVEGIESEMPAVIAAVGQGRSIDVDSIMEDNADGGDAALARSERGRIAQILGDADRSIAEFDESIEEIQEFEERATVSLREIGSHAAALVVNDSMISYEPAGFERVLVYHFQGLNYLMKGDLEAAGVEVRRANAEQELALKAHEDEILEAERNADEQGFKMSDLLPGFMKLFGNSKKIASQVKNSFQNAYTFYMSGVVHELRNEPNDAYIDYKKALEIAPTNKVIQRDVARLATSLNMTEDIAKFRGRFPSTFSAATAVKSSKEEVVILFEDGLVPEKEAVSFPVPIPIPGAEGGTAVSIPIFNASPKPVKPLVVTSAGKKIAESELICAIDALAVKAFEEDATAMLTRQIVRAALKGAAASMATKHGGGLAGAAVSLYNVASEKADTRSWRSLPQNAQVVRIHAKPGQVLELAHAGSGSTGSVTIPEDVGKMTLVRATRVGTKLFVQQVTL